MNTINVINEKTVEEFVATIRSSLQDSNKAWWKIALAFAEAKDMYGFTSDKFTRLCKATNFSKSAASKLANITSSDRLKKYAVKLSAVQSWGTLYAISALSEPHFAELVKVYKLDDAAAGPIFLTQANVDSIRKGETVKSVFKNYAIIKIDEEALKGELVTADDLTKLYDLISQIESITSYVSVTRTQIDEKESAKFLHRINNKETQIARKRFMDAIAATLSRHKKQVGENVEMYEKRCLPMSRSELMDMFRDDPKQAFGLIGADYNYESIYNEALGEASAEANKRANTYAQRVLARVPAVSANPVNNNSSGQKAA